MIPTKNTERGIAIFGLAIFLGIISVILGVVFLVTNPARQFADLRNAQRRSDILTVLSAIYQYSLDNNSAFPQALIGSDLCNTARTDVLNLRADLMSASSTYLLNIPVDPMSDSANSSGYYAVKNTDGHIMVCAPKAENGVLIEDVR